MPLSKQDATDFALHYFGIAFPISREAFKSAFRSAAKRLHPDTTNEVSKASANDIFIRMKAFYDTLVSMNPSWAFVDGTEPLKTTNYRLLSELGLGLGPLVNGRECVQCQHKGYTEEKLNAWQTCTQCSSYGWTYTQPCLRCKGSGKYTNRKGDASFECYVCRGDGYLPSRHLNKCWVCKGEGGKKVPVNSVVYYFCYTCNGVGEIKIYNPVIPKGILSR